MCGVTMSARYAWFSAMHPSKGAPGMPVNVIILVVSEGFRITLGRLPSPLPKTHIGLQN